MPDTAEKAIHYIRDKAAALAKAKSERVYQEQYRKTAKSILMKACVELPVGAQEREAYAHPDYLKVLEDLKKATFEEEKLKWMFKAAEMTFEKWRTMSANERKEKGRYGA